MSYATYYITSRSAGNTKKFDSAKSAAIYMLGKHIDEYFYVKSDHNGDRFIKLENGEFTAMEAAFTEDIF